MRLIVVGAGGFAAEINDWYLSNELVLLRRDSPSHSYKRKVLRRAADKVIYLVESKFVEDHDKSLNPTVLEKFSLLKNDRVIVAINDVDARQRVVTELSKGQSINFVTISHKLASISNQSRVGTGCIIGCFARIGPMVDVGHFSVINNFCSLGNRCEIGSYTSLASHVDIHDSARVGDKVFLGSHSIVAAKKTVSNSSTIGANCFVSRNIGENTVVISQKTHKILRS